MLLYPPPSRPVLPLPPPLLLNVPLPFFDTTDYREFLVGMSIMMHGSYHDRLELAFRAYDLDGNGVIDHHEFIKLHAALWRGKQCSDADIRARALRIFKQADQDDNGYAEYMVMRQMVVWAAGCDRCTTTMYESRCCCGLGVMVRDRDVPHMCLHVSATVWGRAGSTGSSASRNSKTE